MKTNLISAVISIGVLFVFVSARAPADNGTISGLAFGDLYYFANSNSVMKGKSGFWLRRIYLGYDKDLTQSVTSRLRFEMNNSDLVDASTANITPFVKDAYLKWKMDDHNLTVGLAGTPSFEKEEKYWGFRPIEKTPLDLWGFASARDLGVAMDGKLFNGALLYNAMFGNGSGTSNENNSDKKAYLSLAVPVGDFVIELYGDYATAPSGSPKPYTVKAYAAYNLESFRAGVQYSYRHVSDTMNLDLGSAYVAGKIDAGLWAYGRVDRVFDPMTTSVRYVRQVTTGNHKPTLLLAGVVYELAQNAHVSPNLEVVTYDPSDVTTDWIGRMTLSYSF